MSRNSMWRGWWVLILSLLACVSPAGAAEYIIQPADVLSIRVSTEPALSQNYTVDEGGSVALGLEMVGKVKVAGLTTRQARERLTEVLSRYLKLFEVSVFVVGENGSRVLVFGEVAKPGQIRLRPGATLLDALAEAGQPTANADTHRISIVRVETGKRETADLEAVLKDPRLNVMLEAGDAVTVPSRTSASIRINGEVRTVGLVQLENAKTLYAAVSGAGPTERADWTRIALRRKGSEIPLLVDLSRVRSGQLKDDLPLQEGDELTVFSRFSGNASIRGEVRGPGEKELNGPTQLLDFITTAGGGFGEAADRARIQVIRKGQPVRVVDLWAVINGARRTDDPELEVLPGDTVFVPTAKAILRGEVKTPGERPIGSTDNIWDFITTVGGGFTDNADRTNVQVLRGERLVRKLDFTAILRGEKTATGPDLKLEPGDVIFVPNDEQNRFVVVGGVKKPGRYPVTPGMTLLDAIAAAEGLTEKATHKQFVVAPADRYDAAGNFKNLSTASGRKKGRGGDDLSEYGLVVVEFKRLVNGDPTQNPVIKPGDRILIPEDQPETKDKRPSFAQSILRMLPLAGVLLGGAGGLGGLGGF